MNISNWRWPLFWRIQKENQPRRSSRCARMAEQRSASNHWLTACAFGSCNGTPGQAVGKRNFGLAVFCRVICRAHQKPFQSERWTNTGTSANPPCWAGAHDDTHTNLLPSSEDVRIFGPDLEANVAQW